MSEFTKEQIDAALAGMDEIEVSEDEDQEMADLYRVGIVLIHAYLRAARQLSFIDQDNETAAVAFFEGMVSSLVDVTTGDEVLQELRGMLKAEARLMIQEDLERLFPQFVRH